MIEEIGSPIIEILYERSLCKEYHDKEYYKIVLKTAKGLLCLSLRFPVHQKQVHAQKIMAHVKPIDSYS